MNSSCLKAAAYPTQVGMWPLSSVLDQEFKSSCKLCTSCKNKTMPNSAVTKCVHGSTIMSSSADQDHIDLHCSLVDVTRHLLTSCNIIQQPFCSFLVLRRSASHKAWIMKKGECSTDSGRLFWKADLPGNTHDWLLIVCRVSSSHQHEQY